jgi:hypothetical protein
MSAQANLPLNWKAQLDTDIAADGGPKIALTPAVNEFYELWFQNEHGGPGSNPLGLTGEPDAGLNNPFDTSLSVPGSTTLSGNSAGVQDYPDAATGIQATADTLVKSDSAYGYGRLLSALADPSSSLSTLEATENATSWGSAFPTPSDSAPTGYNSTTVGIQAAGRAGKTPAQIASAEGTVTPGVGPLPNPVNAVKSALLGGVGKIVIEGLAAAAGGVLIIMGLLNAAKPKVEQAKQTAGQLAPLAALAAA